MDDEDDFDSEEYCRKHPCSCFGGPITFGPAEYDADEIISLWVIEDISENVS